jgi:predicted anti-sigma-YlaC factor YlaD
VEGRQEGAQGDAGPAQDVVEHLRDCAQCRDETDVMAELLDALADLEQPALPPEIALRIDAALAQAARDDEALSSGATPHASLSDSAPLDEAAEDSTPTSVGVDAPSGHSSAPTRPPSSPSGTRRPASHNAPSRRRLRRSAGWALASLVLVGGVVGLGTVLGSQSKSSTSGGAASAASGATRYPDKSLVQNGAVGGDSSAQAMLAAWTKSVLGTSTASPGSAAGEHSNALTTAPMSSLDAASVSQCEANPAFASRHVVGATYGSFGTTPAVLVVYADGDGSRSVYAVAYAAPCAPSEYRVLAQGTVPD